MAARRSPLSNRLRKKVTLVDNAFSIMRHLTRPWCSELGLEVRAASEMPNPPFDEDWNVAVGIEDFDTSQSSASVIPIGPLPEYYDISTHVSDASSTHVRSDAGVAATTSSQVHSGSRSRRLGSWRSAPAEHRSRPT